jgi:PiT family inorganic phosphate transporter
VQLPEPQIYLDVILGLALCVTLGANNLSTCLGTSMGARTLRYSHALILASIGVLGGILLEGNKVAGAITSGIVYTANREFTLGMALSTLIIMAFLTYRRLPISLSQVAVGAAIGAALAQGIKIRWAFTILVISSWLLTPVAGLLISLALSMITRRAAKTIRRVLSMNLLYAYLTIISGTYAAYVLGANTVGLIVGMIVAPQSQYLALSLAFGLATILGMVLFSTGTTRSVAENIVGMSPSASFAAQMGGATTVHGFTQFGIPVSVSQAVVGGVFGAAIPRNIVVRNDRLTKEIALGWTVAPLVGAILAFFFASIV